MALLFMDGFDHYTTNDVLKKWDSIAYGTSGGVGIESGGRNGGQRMNIYCNNGAGGNSSVSKTIIASTGVTVGCAIWTSQTSTANDGLMLFGGSSGEMIRVGFTATRLLYVQRGATVLATSATAFASSTWTYVEVAVNFSDTVGSIEVRLDEQSVISLSGIDTMNVTNAAGCTTISLYCGAITGNNLRLDDLYILNNTGSVNTTFLGDVRVEAIRPTGAGSQTDFTPSTGANWAAVDDTTPNTSDYVTSVYADQIDTYAYGELAAGAVSVKGVQVNTYAIKTDAGNQKIANVIRHAGSWAASTSQTLAQASWQYRRNIYDLNPVTNASWTVADINAAEFGFQAKE